MPCISSSDFALHVGYRYTFTKHLWNKSVADKMLAHASDLFINKKERMVFV